MSNIILPGDESIVKSNPDVELANLLELGGLGLGDSVSEIKELMDDLKANKGAGALQTRLDLIKHIQSLHGSKASLNNINVGIFVHPGATDKLNY